MDQILTIKFQAQALIDAARYEQAAEVLSRGLSLAPNDSDLLCQMAQVLVALKETGRAASYAERALAVDPENAWAHRLRSLALRQSNRHESLKAAKEAVQLEPQNPWCWHVLAGAHLQVFNLGEARAAAEKMLALAPEWYVSHQALCLVSLKQEKFKEAEAHCRRELELNPNSYEGMNNLGVALLNQKRRREAIETFNRAAKLNPAAPVARSNINVAVSKYLPRITIPFFAIWLFLNGLRVLGERGQSGLVLSSGLFVGGLVGLVLFIRWYRFRQLPVEVKGYVNTLAQAKKFQTRRKWLLVIAQVTGALLALCLMMGLGFWMDGYLAWSAIQLIVVILIAGAFVGSVVALRQLRKKTLFDE